MTRAKKRIPAKNKNITLSKSKRSLVTDDIVCWDQKYEGRKTSVFTIKTVNVAVRENTKGLKNKCWFGTVVIK